MVDRLRQARDLMDTALDSDDDEDAARTALGDLYWRFVYPPSGAASKAAYAKALRSGNAASAWERVSPSAPQPQFHDRPSVCDGQRRGGKP